MDTISEARLSEVHPALITKVRVMASNLCSQGIVIHVIQGLRTYAEQLSLYQQGRDTPGNIVTNAPPGHSWHNYGLAVDCAPGLPGRAVWAPDWNVSHPVWAKMVAEGEKIGLVSGAGWHNSDHPHFQLTGIYPVSPTPAAITILTQHGIQGFWDSTGILLDT